MVSGVDSVTLQPSEAGSRPTWLSLLLALSDSAPAASWDPAAADYTGRQGVTLHVSKQGKQLHVDFENSTLMGYKVFGTRSGEVSYTTEGTARAYVQYQQAVPKGFERLGRWPVDVFDSIGPPCGPRW